MALLLLPRWEHMAATSPPRALKVAVHPSLAPWGPEVKYTLRTLLRVAGYPYRFCWSSPETAVDLYYGPFGADRPTSTVSIVACGRPFNVATPAEPKAIREEAGLPFIEFEPWRGGIRTTELGRVVLPNDIVFSSFWGLTGAREPALPRDRRDNVVLDGSAWALGGLGPRPYVSLYGAWLRDTFRQRAGAPLAAPWASGDGRVPVVLTHDVDYPEIIRWIEVVRLVGRRGIRAFGPAGRILSGRSDFWQFAAWVRLAETLGTRPTFFFMTRQGSLPRYLFGDPDAFYDIEQPRFRRLFRELRDAGCEIGLHASFGAHQGAERLRAERERLEALAAVAVRGVRHHYWHLDPAAPWETLRRQELAGLAYDSSLGFEFHPGFRRGICHPFQPYHPGERRELELVEVPPTWMDDHFDRRLVRNGIADPDAHARALLQVVRDTGGVAALDYHVRGMNRELFPRYGPWLEALLAREAGGLTGGGTLADVAEQYRRFAGDLAAHSGDEGERPRESVRASRWVSIEEVDPERTPAWDHYVEGHPAATIYHGARWCAVTREGLGHEPHYLWARSDDGTVRGVLPLFLVRGLFGRRLVSVPMRDRGGPVADGAPVTAALVHAADDLARRLDCRSVMLRTLAPLPAGAVRNGMSCARSWVTTRIDLRCGVDALWSALDKDGVRWAVKKGRRNGLALEHSGSPESVDAFYDLFVRSKRTLGIPSYPKRFFDAIRRHLIAAGYAELILVRHEGRPVHGIVCFRFGDTYTPAYAAATEGASQLRAGELLIWTTIERAIADGFTTYDFGADSPHQESLHWFKRKWGGVHHPTHAYHHALDGRDPVDFDSSTARYAVARRIWRTLPLPISRTLGGWVARQLS